MIANLWRRKAASRLSPVARQKHLALLAALFLLLVVYPVLRDPAGSPLLARILLTAMFLAASWVVFTTHRLRLLALPLAVPAVLGAWTGYALADLRGPAVAAVFHLCTAAFLVLVTVVLLRNVYRRGVVSADVVAAALCGYLLLGVAFGHVYCLVDAAVPGSFRGLGPRAGESVNDFELTYFSFMTLTTTGYGDISPVGTAARALVQVEAVAGQFYLAVLVADLVGKRVAGAISPDTLPAEEPVRPTQLTP